MSIYVHICQLISWESSFWILPYTCIYDDLKPYPSANLTLTFCGEFSSDHALSCISVSVMLISIAICHSLLPYQFIGDLLFTTMFISVMLVPVAMLVCWWFLIHDIDVCLVYISILLSLYSMLLTYLHQCVYSLLILLNHAICLSLCHLFMLLICSYEVHLMHH